MNKFYISYNEVHHIIQRLSIKILKDFKHKKIKLIKKI